MPEGSTWPDGWYVYEDGKVKGPLAAEEAFCLETEAPSGKPRMISRKGFSQWYALKDLSEIFRLTEELGNKVSSNDPIATKTSKTSETINPSPVVKSRVINQPSTTSKPLTETKTTQLDWDESKAAKKPASNLEQPTTAPLSPTNQLSQGIAESKDLKTSTPNKHPEEPSITKKAKQGKNLTPTTKPKANVSEQATLMQEYFIQRERLRLGKLRNPWINAFVGFPLSFGFIWVFWIKSLAKEVFSHCQTQDSQAIKPKIPHYFLSIIPGFHIYVIWRLAKLIEHMEAQNRYRFISPQTAAWLAIFPPFAMAYLQDSANKHWLLHVKHSINTSKNAVSLG